MKCWKVVAEKSSPPVGVGKRLWLKVKNGLEDLALSAYLHLVLPVSLYFSLTYGAADKPTEMSTVIFPGGTFFSCFWRTGLDFPTRFSPISGFFHGHEK